jgi:LPS export ABC transporter permease LptF/LPS export ABC transporter permease LptG
LRFRLIDRYVLKEMAGPFVVGLVVYSFLFLIQLMFQLASLVIQEGLSAGAMALMFLLSLPGLLAYTLPIALLLGTIIAFGRLSSDSEIIALRASGVPSGKLVRPPLLFGGAVAVMLLVFNFWLVPLCRSGVDKLQSDATQSLNLVRMLRPGVFFDRIPGVLLYAGQVDPVAGRYGQVLVFQRGLEGPLDTLTLAEGGRTVRSPDGQTLQFLLENGETVKFDRMNPGKVETSTFLEQALTVETGPAQQGLQKSFAEFGTMELWGRLDLPPQSPDPEDAAREHNAYLFELHRRLAASLAALFFALIGVSLGMVNVRGGKGAGFSLSLVVLLGYWVILSALTDMAFSGRLNAYVAAYFPDAVLLAVGLVLLRRKDTMSQGGWLQSLLKLFPARATVEAEEAHGALKPIPATRGIPILDRYLVKRMLSFLVLIASSVLLLAWLIDVRGLSEFITNKDKLHLLVTYLLNQSPGVLIMLLPLAVLMTALISFAMLERTNELTAMKASGISLYRISMPALAVGLGACVILWGLGEGVVPVTSRKALAARDAIKGVTSRGVTSTVDVWLFAPGKRQLYHFRYWDAKKKEFLGFSVYSLAKDEFRLASRFFCKRAVFTAPGKLDYNKGWIWRRDPARAFESKPSGTLDLGVTQDYFVLPTFLEGQYFSSRQLKQLIAELRQKGYPVHQQRVDYYQKLSDATAPLVLLMLGLPFAFVSGRKGSLYGIAIALGLSILYYALGAVFNSVGAMQWLDPAVAAWAPTVLLGSAGGYLLLNVRT